MKIALTGAHGFLGWHLRCRLKALRDDVDVVTVGREDFDRLPELVEGADAIVHVAGISRGTDDELSTGNVDLARAVIESAAGSERRPRIVFANSIRAGDGSSYGDGKAAALQVLTDGATTSGLELVDVVLPNLFGEHGRPDHNSFVATFCHEVAAGRVPDVIPREVELLRVQEAAQTLIDGLDGPGRIERPRGEKHQVGEVLDLLRSFHATYRYGEFPTFETPFEADLFNAYRASAFDIRPAIELEARTDPRGAGGEASYATTAPGVTSDDVFHLRRIERFVVVDGQARIRLRKLFSDDVTDIDVSGDVLVAVDIPTMWAHQITNTGDSELLTLVWKDSISDPSDLDTYFEAVA